MMDLIHQLMFNNRILALLEVNDKESIQQARFKIYKENRLIKNELKKRHVRDMYKIAEQFLKNNYNTYNIYED